MTYSRGDWQDDKAYTEKLRAEAEKQKQEQARLAREAAASPKPKKQRLKTPQQAAQTAQPQKREEGFLTTLGEGFQSFISGDYISNASAAVADAANAITPDNWVTKGVTQFMDDNIKSADEIKEALAKRDERIAEEGSGVEKAVMGLTHNLEAVGAGMRGGIAIPMTIAARLANQATPWADPPALIKDHPISSTIFEIAQVLTPTLLTGGVAGGLGKGALINAPVGLTAESAIETVTQDNMSEVILGRQVAEGFGNVADYLGLDGAQLTQDLIEGKTVQSQGLTAAVGFLQNLGINFGSKKLFDIIAGGKSSAVPKGTEDVARVLGRDKKVVAEALENINEPNYSRYLEPHQSVNIDSTVRVAKPSPGNTVISDEALVAEALRKNAIGEDGLTNADRNYFTNWVAVAEDVQLQKIMQEATSTLRALKNAPEDLTMVLRRASSWWDANKSLLNNEDFTNFAGRFQQDMTKPLGDKAEAVLRLTPGMPVERVLKEYSIVGEEGFIASQLVGEELGVRIQMAARVAMNLENAAEKIDFTDAIDTVLDLHDKLNLFLVPLRRAKRKWYVEGVSQQRSALQAVKDADIQNYRVKKQTPSYDAPGDDLTKVHKDDYDPGATIRELWNSAQDGDEGALRTLKDYLNLIAYSEPEQILKETDALNRVLRDQLHKGNKDASAQLFYAYMLSRVGTQVASASSNILRLVVEPMGALLTKDKAYGLGQLWGGLAHMDEARKVFLRSIKTNVPTNGGAKLDEEVFNLKLRQLKLDELKKGAINELNTQGGGDALSRLGIETSYILQSWGNSPLNNAATRLLMASDEATKALFASQVATGRAFQEAAANGTWKDIEAITKRHFNKVFSGGVVDGKIIDAEVIDGAKALTFQSDIPPDGNVVDNLFLSVKNAADTSGVMKFFTPFTRVSYNILEVAGRSEPTGLLRRFVPRYKKILAGEMGDVARLQLQSQINVGRSVAISVASLAGFGLVTGYNSGTMPKTSFIVPTPGTATGYTAIPYSKLEPFATIIAITADAVNGLRDGALSQGEYDRYIQEMIFSVGMASTDKTFQSGLTDMAAMLDVKNFGEGSITSFANASSAVAGSITGSVGGLARMVADWSNPYMTIQTNSGSGWDTFWAKYRSRQFGGIGNPLMYDELTGKAIPKTTTVGKEDNYWAAVAASLVNEFVYPGKVKGAEPKDPVRKQLNALNFTPDVATSIRTLDGVSLNLKQQSELSKVLHLALRPKLEAYFSSDRFKDNEIKRKRFRGDSAIGNTGEGTRSNAYLERIHSDLKAIYREAKMEAALMSQALITDPDFQRKRQAAANQAPISQGSPQWQGIHNILSIPK